MIADQLCVWDGYHDIIGSSQNGLEPAQAIHLAFEATLGQLDGVAFVQAIRRSKKKSLEKIAVYQEKWSDAEYNKRMATRKNWEVFLYYALPCNIFHGQRDDKCPSTSHSYHASKGIAHLQVQYLVQRKDS